MHRCSGNTWGFGSHQGGSRLQPRSSHVYLKLIKQGGTSVGKGTEGELVMRRRRKSQVDDSWGPSSLNPDLKDPLDQAREESGCP